MSRSQAPNSLRESGLPIVHQVATTDSIRTPSLEGHDVALRAAVRSLTVMQKDAIVARSDTELHWRLSSDEGPYLQGDDFAPAPLAHLAAGMAADLLDSVQRSLRGAGRPGEVRLMVDNRYTMEGSLPRGTMVGGALPPEITVFAGGADRAAVTGAVLSGVMASAAVALAATPLTSTFSLTCHGRQISVGRVAALGEPPPSEQERPSEFVPVATAHDGEPLVVKTWDVGRDPADAGSSLQAEQRRELHLTATAGRRPDGLAEIEVQIHRPRGSTFRFLSDEAPSRGGGGRAPDALTYLSAGIGFCFMTQIGRYAKILQRSLGNYHIVQDTRFSYGDVTAHPPVRGGAAAPRTHVFVAPDDEEFAAHALDMSEQTCFIHALCRTQLRPRVKTLPNR